MTDLIQRLRALSRHQHSDMTVGDEAADEIERLTGARDALRSMLEMAVRQNECDMLMTGEELRACRAAIAAAKGAKR